jgi:predicted nicotinamide N-methyase
MAFFDQFDRFQSTSTVTPTPNRLNKRYQAIIQHNAHLISGKTVLDIASHDGRWSFAALKAGASHVIGIEARPDLVQKSADTFRHYGVPEARYRFVIGDAMQQLKESVFRVDVVLLLGYFYHVSQHVDLAKSVCETGAEHIIVDTAIIPDTAVNPKTPAVVDLRLEPINNHANQAIPVARDSESAIVGYPSRRAVILLFDYFGFDPEEFDWAPLIEEGPTNDIPDYRDGARTTFRMTKRRANLDSLSYYR